MHDSRKNADAGVSRPPINMAKLASLSQEYKRLQEDITTYMQSESQLAAQETENQIVMDELRELESDAVVFKLIGNVLTHQHTKVSIETMQNRLKFIKEERKRVALLTEKNKNDLDVLANQINEIQQQAVAAARERQQSQSAGTQQ